MLWRWLIPEQGMSYSEGWRIVVTSWSTGWRIVVTSWSTGWRIVVTSWSMGWRVVVTSWSTGWRIVVTSWSMGWRIVVTSWSTGWRIVVTSWSTGLYGNLIVDNFFGPKVTIRVTLKIDQAILPNVLMGVKKLQLFFNYKYNVISKFFNDATVFF